MSLKWWFFELFFYHFQELSFFYSPVIRGFLLDGEFFISAVLATTLTKVALRFAASETNISHQNLFVAKCMLIMASCLHLGQSGIPKQPISHDDSDRLATCIRILADSTPVMNEIFGGECRKALQALLALKATHEKSSKSKSKKNKKKNVQPDEPIAFQVLTSLTAGSDSMDALEASLASALGSGISKDGSSDRAQKSLSSKLNKVSEIIEEIVQNIKIQKVVFEVRIGESGWNTLRSKFLFSL